MTDDDSGSDDAVEHRTWPHSKARLYTDPDEVLAIAKADDRVIDFKMRVGARPYLRHTPYRNARGVRCSMWSCISVFPKFVPGVGTHDMVFGHPRIVEADESGFPVQTFTDEWAWREVNRARGVALRRVEDTPFGGPLFEGWIDEDATPEPLTPDSDDWPDFACPNCEEMRWVRGFDDATTVAGEGEYRVVAHCGLCEFVVVGREKHVPKALR